MEAFERLCEEIDWEKFGKREEAGVHVLTSITYDENDLVTLLSHHHL